MCRIILVLALTSTTVSAQLTCLTINILDHHGESKNCTPVPPAPKDNKHVPVSPKDDALFLTPFIENGDIAKGQELAAVPLMKDVKSYAGFLTVNKTTGSNLFFWLFKSQQGRWEERPLVIYLEGGPGASSLFGLFQQMGPFSVTKKQTLKRREYSWNRKCNLVFIDNPVGAGFSFTKMESGYARDQNDVARNLYEAIVQLYKLFPPLQKNKLIITGESYAGKFVPAIGYKIYKMNQVSPFKIKLAGLMMGNAFSDPATMTRFGSFLYKLGLVDDRRRDELESKEEKIRANIKAGKLQEAVNDTNAEFSYITNITGLKSLYNYIDDEFDYEGQWVQFLNNSETRKAIHVGKHPFNKGEEAAKYMSNDLLQSVKPWVEELLTAEEFPIMYFSGQLDIVVSYALSVEFYNALKWPRAKEYHNANRCQFLVGSEVAGYYKTAGTFTEVLVRNAGHVVAYSQPKWAFELLDRFVFNSSSFKCV